MEIINIDAGVFDSMLDRFQAFADKVDKICSGNSANPLGEWLDSQDVCLMLNISKRTLQKYRLEEYLPFSYIGNKIYYKPQDVKKLMHNRAFNKGGKNGI